MSDHFTFGEWPQFRGVTVARLWMHDGPVPDLSFGVVWLIAGLYIYIYIEIHLKSSENV